MLNVQYFFSAPVQAVKVTHQNMGEVAEWCGGVIANEKDKKIPGKVNNYVWVPTADDDRLTWAYPGMYVVRRIAIDARGKFRVNWSVFRKDYFDRNYHDEPIKAVDATWTKKHAQDAREAKKRGEEIAAAPKGPDRIDQMNEAQEIDAAEVIQMMEALPKREGQPVQHFGYKTLEDLSAAEARFVEQAVEAEVVRARGYVKGEIQSVPIEPKSSIPMMAANRFPGDTLMIPYTNVTEVVDESLTVTTDDGEVVPAEEELGVQEIQDGDWIYEVAGDKVVGVFRNGESVEITADILAQIQSTGLLR